MKRCASCSQPASWEAYIDDEPIGLYKCSYCKPDPWTAGNPVLRPSGVYYRLLPKEELPHES